MAEENQVTMNVEETTRGLKKETMRGPKEVTTKDPKKIEAGRRLAEYNRRKREELKVQKSKQVEPMLDSSMCYGIRAVLAVGVICSLGYYVYQAKVNNVVPPQQPSHPRPHANKFEME